MELPTGVVVVVVAITTLMLEQAARVLSLQDIGFK
jgi:hypothetical protein